MELAELMIPKSHSVLVLEKGSNRASFPNTYLLLVYYLMTLLTGDKILLLQLVSHQKLFFTTLNFWICCN